MSLLVPSRCFVLAVCLAAAPIRSLEACDFIIASGTNPHPSLARVVGRVVGHGVATRIDLDFRSAASLVLTIEEVTFGPVTPGYVEVVLYRVGPDCSNVGVTPQQAEQRFPRGSYLEVEGIATRGDPFNGVYSQSILAYEGTVSSVAVRPPAALRDDPGPAR